MEKEQHDHNNVIKVSESRKAVFRPRLYTFEAVSFKMFKACTHNVDDATGAR